LTKILGSVKLKSLGGIKWQIVIVNGVDKNIPIPEPYLLIHADRILKGINIPYMKEAKKRSIFVNIVGESIMI
jgi:hypothetical protein